MIYAPENWARRHARSRSWHHQIPQLSNWEAEKHWYSFERHFYLCIRNFGKSPISWNAWFSIYCYERNDFSNIYANPDTFATFYVDASILRRFWEEHWRFEVRVPIYMPILSATMKIVYQERFVMLMKLVFEFAIFERCGHLPFTKRFRDDWLLEIWGRTRNFIFFTILGWTPHFSSRFR